MSCKPCVLGTHLEDKRLSLKFRQEGIESVLAFYRASILTTWLLYRKERLCISFFSCVLKEKYEYCSKGLGLCFQQGMLAKDLKFSERTKTQSRLIFSGLTCCWVPVDQLKEDPCSASWLLQSLCARVNPPLGCTEYLMKEVGALFHKIGFWIPLSGPGAWRIATAAPSPQTPHGIQTVTCHIHGSMFQSWDFLHFLFGFGCGLVGVFF